MAETDQIEQDEIEQQRRREESYARQTQRDKVKQKLLAKGVKAVAGKHPYGKAAMVATKTLAKIKPHKVKSREHGIGTWIAALVLALTKDLLDMGSIELLSGVDWIVDIIIGVIMFFLFGLGVRSLVKRLGTSGAATVAEVIPGVGFLPAWTLSVLYLWWTSGQES